MAVVAPGFFSVSNHINQLSFASVDAILQDNRSEVQSEIAKFVVLGPW
jgi:hypothetical protein